MSNESQSSVFICYQSQACDMLLFNKRITAQEAKDLGLVTDVFPSLSFQDEAWKRIVQISESPPEVCSHH